MAQLEWGSVTHEGQIRTANEDSLLVEPGVFVVADGMGGHQAGEVASALAVERIRRNLLGKPGVLDAVITAINDANADIHEAASGDETKQGMGTTVTALAVIATPNGDERSASPTWATHARISSATNVCAPSRSITTTSRS